MKNDVLLKLLEDLPDDLIDSAADPEPRRSPVFLRYTVPAIAACLVIVLAAVIYPKLRTEKPQQTEESVISEETTAPSSEPGVTGTAPAPAQNGTETDPYSVHIGTAPAITFTGVHGTANTTAKNGAQAQPDDTAQDGQPDDSPEDDSPGGDAPADNAAPGTTAPVTARPVTKTTVSAAPTRQQTTTAPVAAQQQQQSETKPSGGIQPNGPDPGQQTKDNQNSSPGIGTPDTERSDRIPCEYVRLMGGGEPVKNADQVGRDDTPAPATDAESGTAELHGNILHITVQTPCTDAFISYLALKNGELQLEVYYDRRGNVGNGPEFEVTIPWDIVRRVRNVSPEFYEVDDINAFDHDADRVTLVIL